VTALAQGDGMASSKNGFWSVSSTVSDGLLRIKEDRAGQQFQLFALMNCLN
jgi:hypothetical protein